MPEEEKHQALPVAGYTEQSGRNVTIVNQNKRMEELTLRQLDWLKTLPDVDQRWLAIGRTHIEQGFMAINRAVFKPQRVSLSEDAEAGDVQA